MISLKIQSFILSCSTLLRLCASVTEDEDMLAHQRPFLTRDISIGGVRLPISPITVIILTVSALILYNTFTKQTSAVASHILLEGTTDDVKEKLLKMKSEIANDPKKFAEYAAKHSKCPSGKKDGGSLGKFNLGMMVPQFDKAVFSPKTNIGEVIGPIMTPFGYHLIMVHERDEQRQLVAE